MGTGSDLWMDWTDCGQIGCPPSLSTVIHSYPHRHPQVVPSPGARTLGKPEVVGEHVGFLWLTRGEAVGRSGIPVHRLWVIWGKLQVTSGDKQPVDN